MSIKSPISVLFLIALGTGFLVGGCTTPSASAPSPMPAAVAIDSVITQVKQALGDVQNQLVTEGLPPLKQVDLSLQTIATNQGGASIKLRVVTLGGTHETDITQQIDLTLAPPKPGGTQKVSAIALTRNLEDAIISAAEGIKNAGAKPNPLVPTNLVVTLSFAVKDTVKGDANITILPLGPDISGSVARNSVQTLKLTFAAPSS